MPHLEHYMSAPEPFGYCEDDDLRTQCFYKNAKYGRVFGCLKGKNKCATDALAEWHWIFQIRYDAVRE